MEPVYTKEESGYVLTLGERRIEVGPEVALCFDKADSVLLKHGAPALVQPYYEESRKRLIAVGFSSMAEDLVCIVGAFDLEELNKAVSICDYIGKLYCNLDVVEVAA